MRWISLIVLLLAVPSALAQEGQLQSDFPQRRRARQRSLRQFFVQAFSGLRRRTRHRSSHISRWAASLLRTALGLGGAFVAH